MQGNTWKACIQATAPYLRPFLKMDNLYRVNCDDTLRAIRDWI